MNRHWLYHYSFCKSSLM